MCDSLLEGPDRTVILGLGNEDRADDAAGLLAIRELRALGVQCSEFLGDGVSLLSCWSKSDNVILIDAVQSGRLPGTVTVWHGPPGNLASAPTASSHGFGIGEALKLAQALDRLPKSLVIYGIEGGTFSDHDPVSPSVCTAARQLAHTLFSAIKSASLTI